MTLHDIIKCGNNYKWITILNFDTYNNDSSCSPICIFVYKLSVCINRTNYNNADSPFREHSGRFLQLHVVNGTWRISHFRCIYALHIPNLHTVASLACEVNQLYDWHSANKVILSDRGKIGRSSRVYNSYENAMKTTFGTPGLSMCRWEITIPYMYIYNNFRKSHSISVNKRTCVHNVVWFHFRRSNCK